MFVVPVWVELDKETKPMTTQWVIVKPNEDDTVYFNLAAVASIYEAEESNTVIQFVSGETLAVPSDQGSRVVGMLTAHDCTK